MSSKRSARPRRSRSAQPRPHGRLSAGDVGELVGVSGTRIGQWARHGYISASQDANVPHVYSVEDVGEAAVVADLLARGVRRRELRRAIALLRRSFGAWPLTAAELATDGRQVFLRDDGRLLALGEHGWQLVAVAPEVQDVRLRLRRAG